MVITRGPLTEGQVPKRTVTFPSEQVIHSDMQVRSRSELVVGNIYRDMNTKYGHVSTFRLLGIDTHSPGNRHFLDNDKNWIVGELLEDSPRYLGHPRDKGALIDLSLADMGVVAYGFKPPNESWNPSNWLEKVE